MSVHREQREQNFLGFQLQLLMQSVKTFLYV